MSTMMKQTTEQFIEGLVYAGGELRDALGLTQAQIELMYAYAYEEYQKANYEKAKQIFTLLTQINHTDKRFHFGSGATLQCLGLYGDAINAYMNGSMLDLTDPYPTVTIGYCLIQIKEYAQAKNILNLVVEEAYLHEEYVHWREKALYLLDEIARLEVF